VQWITDTVIVDDIGAQMNEWMNEWTIHPFIITNLLNILVYVNVQWITDTVIVDDISAHMNEWMNEWTIHWVANGHILFFRNERINAQMNVHALIHLFILVKWL